MMKKLSTSRIDVSFCTCGKMQEVVYLLLIFLLAACSSQNKSHKALQQNSGVTKTIVATDTLINNFLTDSSLLHAFVGVSIYDPSSKKYIHQYNDDKYFV